MIFLIILIVAAFIFFRLKKNAFKFTFDNVTFFQGSLGAGKTAMLTYHAIKERKRRVLNNFIATIINPFILVKKWKIKKRGTDIYSTYPIYVNKRYGYSYVCSIKVLKWIERVNEDCIVVLDEVGFLFPSEMKKTDPKYTFCMTWLRHATNAFVLSASQSLSECNVLFRRKVNRVYALYGMRRRFLIRSCVNVRSSICSEDMTNIYSDTDPQLLFTFKYPSKNFHSRYGKQLYDLLDDDIKKLSVDFDYLLSLMGYKFGDKWRSLDYSFEIDKKLLIGSKS